MKYSIFAISSLVFLASCTWWWAPSTESPTPINTYPSVPLSASGEIATPVATPVATQKGESYKATGNKPTWWSADVSATGTILNRGSEDAIKTLTFSTSQSDKWALVTISGVKGDFFINLVKGTCSDGISEAKYTYKATVLVGSETLTGCASK